MWEISGKKSVIFILLALRVVYIGLKATSLTDSFIEKPIECSHWAVTKINENIRFRVRFYCVKINFDNWFTLSESELAQ